MVWINLYGTMSVAECVSDLVLLFWLCSGGSENLNQYVLTFFALLVYCGVVKQVFGNRLPVGHTHIDIDARHQIYTTFLKGRGESGGMRESILTLSEFDSALNQAYKTDKFSIKRKFGLLDVKTAWEGVLACSNFSPQRKHSDSAKAQGGADHEPMCFRFFKHQLQDGSEEVLMQYRYSEADTNWFPPDYAGIPVLEKYKLSPKQCMETTLSILNPKIWDFEIIKKNILRTWRLSEPQKLEWNNFFDSVPVCTSDVTPDMCFQWNLKKLVLRKKKVKPAVQLEDPCEYDQQDEIIVWKNHTTKDVARERKIRAILHSKKQRIETGQQQLDDAVVDDDATGSDIGDDDNVSEPVRKSSAKDAKKQDRVSQQSSQSQSQSNENKRMLRSSKKHQSSVRILQFQNRQFIHD